MKQINKGYVYKFWGVLSERGKPPCFIWNWNHAYRASPAFRARPFFQEDSPPDAQCVSFTHDRDFEAITKAPRPEGAEKFAGTAWCPPPHAEYDGFRGTGGRYRDRLEQPPVRARDPLDG